MHSGLYRSGANHISLFVVSVECHLVVAIRRLHVNAQRLAWSDYENFHFKKVISQLRFSCTPVFFIWKLKEVTCGVQSVHLFRNIKSSTVLLRCWQQRVNQFSYFTDLLEETGCGTGYSQRDEQLNGKNAFPLTAFMCLHQGDQRPYPAAPQCYHLHFFNITWKMSLQWYCM